MALPEHVQEQRNVLVEKSNKRYYGSNSILIGQNW